MKKIFYRFYCDLCAKVKEQETDTIPHNWRKVTTEMFERDFADKYACDRCMEELNRIPLIHPIS